MIEGRLRIFLQALTSACISTARLQPLSGGEKRQSGYTGGNTGKNFKDIAI